MLLSSINPHRNVSKFGMSIFRYNFPSTMNYLFDGGDVDMDEGICSNRKKNNFFESHNSSGKKVSENSSCSSSDAREEFSCNVDNGLDSDKDSDGVESDNMWEKIYDEGYDSPYFEDEVLEFSLENRCRGRMEIKVGNTYGSKNLFQLALKECAMLSNFQIEPIRTSHTAISAKCAVQSCPWRIHATKLRGVPTFEIKKLISNHTCALPTRGRDHRQASSSWIAVRVKATLKEHPNMTPGQIITYIQKHFGVTISYRKAWRAKEFAVSELVGSWDESYRILPSYCAELTRVDPDAVTVLVCREEDRFARFFWSFGACIKSYKNNIRGIISIDAAHLKGKYRGQLLVATSLDGNNKIFPIAFAVVESENTDSWSWFFRILGDRVIGIESRFVLISDRHPGILESVPLVFPNVIHGFCLRHLCENFVREFKDNVAKQKIWMMGKIYGIPAFEREMLGLRESQPKYYKWLSAIDQTKWTRAYFPAKRYRMMTTNISECVNKVLKLERELPITALVHATHTKLSKYFFERSEECKTFKDQLTPFALREIMRFDIPSNYVDVRQTGTHIYEVGVLKNRYVVDLEKLSCTCRRYDQLGLPCLHAISAIKQGKMSPYDFSEDWFTVDRYRETYKDSINPTVDESQWSVRCDDVIVSPPDVLIQPGRPKKERFKSQSEKHLYNRCGNCGRRGHNRRRCVYPPAS